MCIRDRDEINTPVSTEITKADTSISTMSDNKPDGTAEMMKILLNKFDSFDKKLDEQKNDTDVKFTHLNDKFDSFEIKFSELKNEIKGQNFHLEERIDTIETRCDNIQKTTLAIVDDKFNSTCLLYTSRCV